LAAAGAAGGGSFLFVALCLAGLGWYAARGKQAGLAGNAAVAALAALAVGYGALAAAWTDPAARPERALVPAALAGLLHLMRELVKDAQDLPGDRQAGRRTWVLRAGAPALRRLLGQLAVTALLPPLLSLLLTRGDAALRLAHLAALAVSPWLLRLVLAARLDEDTETARLSRRLKQALALGLALYLLAALA
jgi:4-hydroxybenzoate polyprenyltransferase